MKFNIKNKPFLVCIVLSIISMKYFSAVLMLIALLISAILAMDGFKKGAIYTSIQAAICGIFGLVMGHIVDGLSEKVNLVTAYPSLVDNPGSVIKLHTVFNTMQFTQIGFIVLFIIMNIIIIKIFGNKLQKNKNDL